MDLDLDLAGDGLVISLPKSGHEPAAEWLLVRPSGCLPSLRLSDAGSSMAGMALVHLGRQTPPLSTI